jgi:hypothetical protein
MISTDDPMIAKNHTYLLRKVLAEDSSTRKAIRYLEENKKDIPDLTLESNILLLEPLKDSSG